MSTELVHHGIRNQKWGLRRFQNPDGSLTPAGRERYGVGKKQSDTDGDTDSKSPPKTKERVGDMTDDELRARINRLNMEEQYANLISRKKTRDGGVVKELLGKATRNLAEQSLNKVVDKLVHKMFDEKDDFNIDDYRDADVHDMDSETIKKVADWYNKAGQIKRQRDALKSGQDKEKTQDKKKTSPKTELPASTDDSEAFHPHDMTHGGNRDTGKDLDPIERDRRKRDKWIG